MASLHVEPMTFQDVTEGEIIRRVQAHLAEIAGDPVLLESYLSLTESNLESARNYHRRTELPQETWTRKG